MDKRIFSAVAKREKAKQEDLQRWADELDRWSNTLRTMAVLAMTDDNRHVFARAFEDHSFFGWEHDRSPICSVFDNKLGFRVAPSKFEDGLRSAAQAWSEFPGFGFLVGTPPPSIAPSPKIPDVGWRTKYVDPLRAPATSIEEAIIAQTLLWHARVPAGNELAEAVDELFQLPRDAQSSVLNAFAELARFNSWRKVASLPTDIHRARSIAMRGAPLEASDREVLRRGLCALEDPGSHVAAYFGDSSALRTAAAALDAFGREDVAPVAMNAPLFPEVSFPKEGEARLKLGEAEVVVKGGSLVRILRMTFANAGRSIRWDEVDESAWNFGATLTAWKAPPDSRSLERYGRKLREVLGTFAPHFHSDRFGATWRQDLDG